MSKIVFRMYELGVTLPRDKPLKRGKGKSSYKPLAGFGFSDPKITPIEIQLTLESQLSLQLEDQIAIVREVDGDINLEEESSPLFKRLKNS